MTGLFDNDTFILNEKPLPADVIIPAKLACKTKLSIYGGLDKLKITIYLRGQRSRVDGSLYILYRKGNDWIKLINYVDDAL